MALTYKPPIPADAFAAAVPAAFTLLHFVRLGATEPLAGEPLAGEPLAGEPFPNALSEPFEGLPDPFCAEPPVPFEPFKVDPSCIKLTTPIPISTAAACVTVTVY